MELLEFLREGQVYEVLLVTRSNVTPVGVVRKGERLFFKLFGGKSAGELKEHPYASLQVTNDVELIVKLALNVPVKLEFEGNGRYRWIKTLPGVYGRVKWREEPHEDELGKATVMKCSLEPAGVIAGVLPPMPLSRADFHLLEMAVDFTRLEVARRNGKIDVAKKLRERIVENYSSYRRFGGSSELAEAMMAALDEGG
ncbi:hypothetical protein CL1_1684 [Thermococcus cleftensis]|uniref:DUF447 family protein n=1 Tax=Thermococcus cleftensis (strain DSM 27260 / KACC 17922 / CL1) TaxID=163003 RepID=I3ZVZ7_THECF|nr:DUF447 domain-containing protein [Thermococcus cleftensis]AFL95881.1 hypothetical protein CL1_1684 [Thermococcus cleftensis]